MTQPNIQHLIQAGDRQYARQNFAQAVELYDKAYRLQSSHLNQVKLVQALHANQQNKSAATLISNYVTSYLKTYADTQLAVAVFLKLEDLIGAYQFVQNVTWHDDQQQQLLDQQIKQAAQAIATSHPQLLARLSQRVLTIVTSPLSQQLEVVTRLHQLDLPDYLEQAKILVLHPYLHPLIKAGVMDDLVKLRLTEVVPLSFYGEMKTVVPNELPIIANLQSLNALQQQLSSLQSQVGHNYEALSGELNLYAAMLYPFTDQIITDPSFWLKMIMAKFGYKNTGKTLEKDLKAVKVNKWLSKFEELLSLFN